MKIAIASGKGGTGKTFVSTNLFYASVYDGNQITLVDCDAEAPNTTLFLKGVCESIEHVYSYFPSIDVDACAFCGKCVEACHFNAIFYLSQKKRIHVLNELCHSCGACSYVCKHGAITEHAKSIGTIKRIAYRNTSPIAECRMEIGVASPVPIIKQAIRNVDNDAMVLLDSPPGVSCPFIATVETADYVILVTEPTPFGLNDLRLSIQTLQQMGIAFGVIINRDGIGNQKMENWLNEENIPILMKIPYDSLIAETYAEGKIVSEINSMYLSKFRELMKILEENSTEQRVALCKK